MVYCQRKSGLNVAKKRLQQKWMESEPINSEAVADGKRSSIDCFLGNDSELRLLTKKFVCFAIKSVIETGKLQFESHKLFIFCRSVVQDPWMMMMLRLEVRKCVINMQT
jgi:hypothetical protein